MWPFVIRIKCIEAISIWTRAENGLARTEEYKMTSPHFKPYWKYDKGLTSYVSKCLDPYPFRDKW